MAYREEGVEKAKRCIRRGGIKQETMKMDIRTVIMSREEGIYAQGLRNLIDRIYRLIRLGWGRVCGGSGTERERCYNALSMSS